MRNDEYKFLSFKVLQGYHISVIRPRCQWLSLVQWSLVKFGRYGSMVSGLSSASIVCVWDISARQKKNK